MKTNSDVSVIWVEQIHLNVRETASIKRKYLSQLCIYIYLRQWSIWSNVLCLFKVCGNFLLSSELRSEIERTQLLQLHHSIPWGSSSFETPSCLTNPLNVSCSVHRSSPWLLLSLLVFCSYLNCFLKPILK